MVLTFDIANQLDIRMQISRAIKINREIRKQPIPIPKEFKPGASIDTGQKVLRKNLYGAGVGH